LRTDPAHKAAASQRWPDAKTRAAETQAAEKASVHADTPAITHFDSLGRPFLTVAHNRFKRTDTPAAGPPTEQFYETRVGLDIEGNQREVIDAKGRVVMRYDYDMLGNHIHQASMEAGERWTLNDVSGQPVRGWDSRGHNFRTEYDELRRPVRRFVRGADADDSDPRTLHHDVLFERTEYGEGQANDTKQNLRARVFRQYDGAGVVTNKPYDFKGNLLGSGRRLSKDYKGIIDWAAAVQLGKTYSSSTAYDALNRPVKLTAPEKSVIRPTYNEASLLECIDVNLHGTTSGTSFITDIDYDAKGQRTLIDYGNGVRTTYAYDPLTFRLVHLLTRRKAASYPKDCPQPSPAAWPGCHVQNLHYTYDPAGNITHIRDDAQQKIYFRNRRVEPSNKYTYDALYRLIEATGREHLGQNSASAPRRPSPASYNDGGRAGRPHPGDGKAMGMYVQRFVYDEVGNFLKMTHRGSDPGSPGWNRTYSYKEPSQIQSGKRSNRLTSTTVNGKVESYSKGGNGYDPHGNMLSMPQLAVMRWDFQDQLLVTQRQRVNQQDVEGNDRQAERTYYVYDAAGQRVRKVTELATGQLKDERIYLGGFEIYRRHGMKKLTRETLHIMDGERRIALVETRTAGSEPGVPKQLIRYQLGNHLDSTNLELDHEAGVITYEEYYPYGSTSYQAVRSQTQTPKRYRYTGKERDEESGLYYHGARYYAPWLGRWTSCDPAGLVDGPALYAYAVNNPPRLVDRQGTQAGEGFDWYKWHEQASPEERIKAKALGERQRETLSSNDMNQQAKVLAATQDLVQVPGVTLSSYYSSYHRSIDESPLPWVFETGWMIGEFFTGEKVSARPIDRKTHLMMISLRVAGHWGELSMPGDLAGLAGSHWRRMQLEGLNFRLAMEAHEVAVASHMNVMQGVPASEVPGLQSAIESMASRNWRLSPVQFKYSGNRGLDLHFEGVAENLGERAIVEAKPPGTLGQLDVPSTTELIGGLRQSGEGYIGMSLATYIERGGQNVLEAGYLMQQLRLGNVKSYTSLGGQLYEMKFFGNVDFRRQRSAAKLLDPVKPGY
ncbi:MAG: RHS repeat-associated core domain-containing protein, partial [Chloroflexota bacterium]|nr:RHS repeat-associated core domain-containing protein [Chloroflexota bacterium]